MSAPFDDSEHTRIAQSVSDYDSIGPWNDDFSNRQLKEIRTHFHGFFPFFVFQMIHSLQTWSGRRKTPSRPACIRKEYIRAAPGLTLSKIRKARR